MRPQRSVKPHRIAAALLGAGFMLLATAAGPAAPVPGQELYPREELPVTLVGPRRVVVRDLPSVSLSAAGEARRAVAPRGLPAPDAAAVDPPPAANAVDPTFSAQPELLAPPVLSTAGFEGLDNNDNPFQLAPPDPQVAVGPNHVFEMVNVVGRVYTRTGGNVQTFTLASFFGVPAGYDDTDPKILYDALSGRWFASYISFVDKPGGNNDEGRLHIAVSQSSDPTGPWSVYDGIYQQIFPDYPAIGITSDKFTVSSNVWDIDNFSLYYGVETLVFEKADLLAGVPAGSVGRFAFPRNTNRYTVRPAQSLSPASDQYLVTRGHVSSPFEASSTRLVLIRVTGTPDAGNVVEASTTLTILPQAAPPDSPTAGGGTIDSFDFRFLDAMWRDGRLWTSGSAACIPLGDTTTRSCAHLIEVDTAASSVAQDIVFGAPGEYFSFPAVRTDPSGHLYVSLTHTNPTIFAEARAAGRLASDPPNAISGSVLLRPGEVLHSSGQWGDYLGVAVDPSFPGCVWLVGQYAKDTSSSGWDWGTVIAAASYSSGCDGDNDGFSDGRETISLGTDPAQACAQTATPNDETPDPWPPDADDDRDVDVGDLLTLFYGKLLNPPSYSPRSDFDADGDIDIGDVLGAMFGRIGTSCA